MTGNLPVLEVVRAVLEAGRPGRFTAAAEAAAPRAWYEVFLIAMGACLTCAAFLTLVWKIAQPHVVRYLRNLQQQLDDVHAEVKPDKGSSMRDTAEQLSEDVRQLGRQLGRANRQITAVDGRTRMVDGMLRQHLEESRHILRGLHEQGIVTDVPDDVEGDKT